MRLGLLIVMLLGSACGGPEAVPQRVGSGASKTKVETATETEARLLAHFKFESSVDATTKTIVQSDLKRLANWSDSTRADAFSKLADISGVSTVNAQNLATWLTDRVTYLSPATGGNMDLAIVKSAKKRIITLAAPGAPKAGIVAANMGPQIYEAYRVNKANGADGVLLKFDGNWVSFLGLRTGVIHLGASTFSDADTGTDAAGEGLRIANSIFRISALYHEARHSDGNAAASTHGMLHTTCPSDGSGPEEYAGQPACDSNGNGPYTLGAKVIDALMGMCDAKCSEKEKSALQAFVIDYLSRVLVKTEVDDSAEANLTKIDSSMFEVVASGG